MCPRCGGMLLRHRTGSIERGLALTLTLTLAGLLLFGVANLFPVMTLKMAGQAQATTLLGVATALYRSGSWELAGPVLIVAILIPFLKLAGSVWILGLALAGRLTRAQAPVFRLVEHLHPWAMDAATTTLNTADGTLRSVADLAGRNSQLRREASLLMTELTTAARSVRTLTDYLERHPESLLRGKQGGY